MVHGLWMEGWLIVLPVKHSIYSDLHFFVLKYLLKKVSVVLGKAWAKPRENETRPSRSSRPVDIRFSITSIHCQMNWNSMAAAVNTCFRFAIQVFVLQIHICVTQIYSVSSACFHDTHTVMLGPALINSKSHWTFLHYAAWWSFFSLIHSFIFFLFPNCKLGKSLHCLSWSLFILNGKVR